MIGSEEKDESLFSQGNKDSSFLFYGSMHFFIHFYPGAVLGFLSVIGLTEKLYKILCTLSVVLLTPASFCHTIKVNCFRALG